MKLFPGLLTAVAAVLLFPTTARADMPGKHPAYLHALTDLRHARAHLAARGGNSDMKWDEQTAIREVDAAINEIKKAAIDDGKNIDDHPPVDAAKNWNGKLHRALELLEKARHDIEGEEDNDFAHGLRHRAIEHIDAAINFTKQGLTNSH